MNLSIKNITVRNGVLFSFFSFANSGVSFILLIILAKYITPIEYGYLNLFNTLVTLLNIFISLCTVSYVTLSFFKKDKSELLKIINVSLIVSSIMLIILFVIISIFTNHLEHLIGIDYEYQVIALLICYFQIFNAINLDIWRIEEKPISYGFYSLGVVLLNFVITLFLIIGLEQGWLGRVYSQLSVSFIFGIISIIILIKRRYFALIWPGLSLFKETLLYCLPLIPHIASFWLRQGLDRYIINYYHSVEDVGLFSFALNFASIIGIAGMAFNSTNSVYIYKKLAINYSEVKASLKKQTRFMLLFFLCLTILVAVVVSIGIPLIVPHYTASIAFLFPVCFAAFFQCVYLLFVNYLFYYGRTLLLMTITLSMSVLSVVLSLILTKYGVIYTAYISLFISASIAFSVYLFASKILKQQN